MGEDVLEQTVGELLFFAEEKSFLELRMVLFAITGNCPHLIASGGKGTRNPIAGDCSSTGLFKIAKS